MLVLILLTIGFASLLWVNRVQASAENAADIAVLRGQAYYGRLSPGERSVLFRQYKGDYDLVLAHCIYESSPGGQW